MKHWTYYIPLVGGVKYLLEIERGEAYISESTDVFFAFHGCCTLLLLVIFANSLS